ncbi:MAG: hypothetical protein ACRDUY_08250 [Nitriliruptorales bacterium]
MSESGFLVGDLLRIVGNSSPHHYLPPGTLVVATGNAPLGEAIDVKSDGPKVPGQWVHTRDVELAKAPAAAGARHATVIQPVGHEGRKKVTVRHNLLSARAVIHVGGEPSGYIALTPHEARKVATALTRIADACAAPPVGGRPRDSIALHANPSTPEEHPSAPEEEAEDESLTFQGVLAEARTEALGGFHETASTLVEIAYALREEDG